MSALVLAAVSVKLELKVTAARIAGPERVQYGLMSRYVSHTLDLPDLVLCPEETVTVLINYASQQSSKPVLISTADVYLLFIDRFRERLNKTRYKCSKIKHFSVF
jgi:hypothetical protein